MLPPSGARFRASASVRGSKAPGNRRTSVPSAPGNDAVRAGHARSRCESAVEVDAPRPQIVVASWEPALRDARVLLASALTVQRLWITGSHENRRENHTSAKTRD